MPEASPLATPTATAEVLRRHGLSPKKAFGQNFLVNDAIVQKILELAEVTDGDRVLEVGPGIGTLTSALLARGTQVVAIERDGSLACVLDETLSEWSERFRLIEMDALDVSAQDLIDETDGALPSKFVANLPYAVAATVVLNFFQEMPFIESATVMVQREVAERMMAMPGTKDYGAYTVKLAMYARHAGHFLVGPGNFYPPPHVESMVIRLDRRNWESDVTPEEIAAACTMADAAFFARRKTILNSCKQYFASRGAKGSAVASSVGEILDSAGIDPAIRGEKLSPAEYLTLGRALLYSVVLPNDGICVRE